MSRCGMIPKLNASRLADWMYDNPRIPGNLERWFKTCTYNQLTFTKENNPIVEIDLPCQGTTEQKRAFDFKNGKGNGKNEDNEVWGLGELAYSWLKQNYPFWAMEWGRYRKIFIYPYNWATNYVQWSGLAVLGCNDKDLSLCYTWINTETSVTQLQMSIVVQELVHNVGLVHSSRKLFDRNQNKWVHCEYCDQQCPMGWGEAENNDKQLLCTNAAQSYKAGWAKPISGGHINAFDLPPGVTQQFTLPSMHLSKDNMLRIIYDQWNRVVDGDTVHVIQDALFVSYRVRQNASGAYDSGLSAPVNRRVWKQ
ncbi:hypothetical protein PLESTB_001588700 [Pleodorina starrii]|uniref:Peptidase M11 gametolysin domain-containing protein n=1 Tax=Pleodorina starrii TaxID=330485 RepID=A0A9W6BZ80_9CHLO|nr:hypothetical protein PLESTB_001588700 [Pleodorina starrii]